MSAAQIIDGKVIAQALRTSIAMSLDQLSVSGNIVPGLAVILVGEDPASQIYVGSKGKAATEAGIKSWTYLLPADIAEDELLSLIERLNGDSTVHGILVQMPLPRHIDTAKVIMAIDPRKDVDGLHPLNLGRLMAGSPYLLPCTPQGCLRLLQSIRRDLAGLHACVVGRSAIVGKPMGLLLLAENATVTFAHSRTVNLDEECRRADILIAAVGKPALIRGDWIKPGALVIDVGINRIALAAGENRARVVGDVAFDEAVSRAAAITPVPGGVGPMTIACLLLNTLQAACLQKNLPAPVL